jgi:hypothetical protein
MGGFSATPSDTMCDELCQKDLESLPLPKKWAGTVRHAVLNVIVKKPIS